MINTKTNEFMAALTDLVNRSGLPACNVRLCLELVKDRVKDLEIQALAEEKREESCCQEQLEAKVEKHNQVVERTALLEEKMKVANHRLDDLEESQKG